MIRFLLRWLDMPPVWLAGFAALAWGQAAWLPFERFGGWADWAGLVLIALGGFTALEGLWELIRHHTSFIPGQTPKTLVEQGVFRLTRNPIYLADAMILGGLVLKWDAVLSLVLIPAFMALIQKRFIRGEEVRIREAFGDRFESYAGRVRRWM